MIQAQTICKTADNSGVKKIRVIKVLGRGRKTYAGLGDVVVASAIEVNPLSEIKKKTVIKAVVVRTKKMTKRPDGSGVRFDDNAVVLINEERLPRGTRVIGPVGYELKQRKFSKIVSLAPEVI